jgi:hypothetical protein
VALGNWRFRLHGRALDDALALRLRTLALTYERVS